MPRVTLNQRPLAVNESKTEGRAKDSKKPCGQNPRVFSGLEQTYFREENHQSSTGCCWAVLPRPYVQFPGVHGDTVGVGNGPTTD